MNNKKFHIVFFDERVNDNQYSFSENVCAIIEKLRLEYYRNKSLKTSEHSLLIVTDENIKEGYPNIETYIFDIVHELSKKTKTTLVLDLSFMF